MRVVHKYCKPWNCLKSLSYCQPISFLTLKNILWAVSTWDLYFQRWQKFVPPPPTKNTSMHLQARLDNEDWKEGHFFIPKISLYKITLSTYCIVTKWTNEDIVIGSCGIISPRRKHCGTITITITTNQHPHPLIMRQHLFSFHSSWGFTWRQASFFERENSWKWTPQTCFPQFHIKAGFWCWETSWKWTPQTCSQETLKHLHEKTSRNSPGVCSLPQNMNLTSSFTQNVHIVCSRPNKYFRNVWSLP